jgi:CheY-like chemotaxis protein
MDGLADRASILFANSFNKWRNKMNDELHNNALEGRRIFVVEDDIMNVGVFHTCLSRQGARVFQDILGYGIVQHIVESLPIDLIVLDIQLRRGNNGWAIFEELKSDPQLDQIPVVAVTALDPETEILMARKLGFSGYLSKPIDAIEFPFQIARILKGESIWLTSR